MNEIDEKYQMENEISLDEFKASYRHLLTPSELEDIDNHLEEFDNL